MKTIPLNKNKFAMVDDGDYNRLSSFKWYYHPMNYACTVDRNTGNTILMHRMLLPSKIYTDHINNNGLDNRVSNLRAVSAEQNSWNRTKRLGTHSQYKGVSYHTRQGSWVTQIMYQGKARFIGYFKDEHHAALAYDLWAKDLFGEFAKLNFNSI